MSLRPEHPHDVDLDVAVADGRAVVRVSGEVDAATAPKLRAALADGLARHHRDGVDAPVVVELSGVTFMGATGLGVLVSALGRARRLGRDLVLRNPPPMTLRVLDLTGLLDIFAIEWDAGDRSLALTGPRGT
jgi:anti-anti-sigma factor